MKQIALILGVSVVLLFSSLELRAQLPVQGLKVWLCADSGMVLSGSSVTQWNDLSGNNFDFLQSTPSNMPQKHDSVFGQHSAVYFDGVNDYIEAVFNDTFAQPCTYFVIWKAGPLVNLEFIFDGISSGYRNAFYFDKASNYFNYWAGSYGGYSYSIPSTFSLHNPVFNGAQSKVYVNGVLKSSDNPGTQEVRGLRLGFSANNSLYFNGWITDFIYYNKALNNSERDSVEKYLMNRLCGPVALGSDTTIAHGFCPYTIHAGSGYTSYLWSTGSTADSIVVNETGDYWVQATDIFNRTSRDTIHVQYPYTALPDRDFCLTDTIEANTGLDHAYSFLWSDSSTDSSLQIWEPGEYWVEITDSTLAHCSVRDTFVVAADSFAVNVSLGPDLSMCSGNDISLVSGTEPGIDYLWSTGDTTESIVIHTAGPYWVSATNADGCVARDTVSVSISGVRPSTAFNSDVVCQGNATNFYDASWAPAPDGIAAWSWNFAGQGTSSYQNPQFGFSSSGDFDVELVVTTDSGCFGDTTITVHVRALPQAWFLPVNGCNGQEVDFLDQTAAGEGSVYSWSWNFGDGTVGSTPAPAHIYSTTGTYDTRLIVQDIYGCRDTVERPVNIRLTPVVDFEFEESCLGIGTDFTETTNMPAWAEIVNRTWDFGDGYYSSAKMPSHIFPAVGTYSVKLINRSINGCVDSVSKDVTVYPYPVAGFESELACEGTEVCFHDTSYVAGGTIAQWLWSFGNGSTAADSDPCTMYPDTGFYNVQLKVVSDFGCSTTVNGGLRVYPVPHSDFSLTPEYGIPALDVQFYNYTSGATSYNWSFGDGAYSPAINPQHTYEIENIYEIALVGTNEFGCTDTAYGNVYVIPSVLDLMLTKLTVTDSAGYLYLKAQFFNNGTRNIRKVALDARVGKNVPIREEWNGLLEPGQYNEYVFTASFLKPDVSNIRLVCLDISTLDSYGQEDTEPQNNASCHSLVEDFFIASVFPNPVSDNVYADISIPDDGDVNISLTGSEGRELIRETIEDAEAGTLRIKMDLRFLAAGVYVLHAEYKDKSDTYRFVKTTE